MALIAPEPNLSGEWKLNLDASTLSLIVASAVRSGVLRIEHREPHFHSHLTIVFDSGPVEARFEGESDGREIVANDERGQRITSSLAWEGEVLIAACRIQGTGFEMSIVFRYELLEGGQRLRASEQLRSAGRDQDNVWVFDRVPSA